MVQRTMIAKGDWFWELAGTQDYAGECGSSTGY